MLVFSKLEGRAPQYCAKVLVFLGHLRRYYLKLFIWAHVFMYLLGKNTDIVVNHIYMHKEIRVILIWLDNYTAALKELVG